MTQKLIVFAQKSEANKTIERLNAKALPESLAPIWSEGVIPTCYAFDGGWIVITNVGIHSAQMAVSKYIHCVNEVWNIGLAGTLSDNLPIGSLIQIGQVGKLTLFPTHLDEQSKQIVENTIPSLSLNHEGAKLISSDFPVHDNKLRESIAANWQLVDMEGYGVAYAATGFQKPCRIWKIVSDFASAGGRELIRKNKANLSEAIAEFLCKCLVKKLF